MPIEADYAKLAELSVIDTRGTMAGHGNWYHCVLPVINIYNFLVVSEITNWLVKDKKTLKFSSKYRLNLIKDYNPEDF